MQIVMESSTQILLAAFLVMSLWAFVAFWWDKRQARLRGSRISEKTLLLLTALAGAPGALLGMKVFRHKTVKSSFRWKFFLCLLPNLIWIWLALRPYFD